MLRHTTIGQPDAFTNGRVTDINDLKYISRVLDVLIPVPLSAKGLLVAYATCAIVWVGSLYDVISVDYNVPKTIIKTVFAPVVSVQHYPCVIDIIPGKPKDLAITSFNAT